MADKKKMSVADILAAARKADSKQSVGAGADEPTAQPASEAAASGEQRAAQRQAPVAEGATEPAAKPTPPAAQPAGAPAKPKQSGGRPSVAEMLAMARAGGKAGDEPGAAPAKPSKPAAGGDIATKLVEKAKPAGKTAAERTAPKAVEKPPKGEAAAGVKDTASILAAAHKPHKPGPMSKAEAARAAAAVKGPTDGAGAKGVAAKAAPAKPPKPAVPPMPAKPDYAKTRPAAAGGEDRRFFLAVILGSFLGLGFTSLAATFGLWTLGLARFMFPNILTEPPSKFKVGFPSDFPPGSVEEKFKALFGVWVVNFEYQGQPQIYALRSVCTHLGCTPNWLEGEQKFKCPCHGSGFYKDGINFEGPAPRPLERYAIQLADDGQIEIDKSKLFQEEMGQWSDSASYVPA